MRFASRWIPLVVLLGATALQRVRAAAEPAGGQEQAAPGAPAGDPALPGLKGDPDVEARLATALASKGPGYHPRTRHLLPGGKPRYTNRLILESSPYLLQHAHNPVNWYAWDDEPFERARREGKPVFLSIGYSTCHWCHVMEKESFEDEEIARYLNEHYVAIKVDREERPGVDALYLNVVIMMTGSGGWPATLFLTPSREPFFAGTYFPARDGDRPGAPRRSTCSSARSRRWRQEASTITSAAGFTATRRTTAGSCRTSRRCSTTTPSSPWPTSRATSSPGARTSRTSRGRRSITSTAR
jgi:hypothetical protein